MDPNACLERIRRLVKSQLQGDGDEDEYAELAEHCEALDEWLSKGGFVPLPWAEEGEKLAALQAAERLIQAHRLSEAEISASSPESVTQGDVAKQPRETWKICVMNCLAERYGCTFIAIDGRMVAFGAHSDIDILRVQVERICDLVRHTSLRACAGQTKRYLNSYRLGMVSQIISRLRADDRPATAQSVGIVRLDQRKGQAEAARNAAFPQAVVVSRRPYQADGRAANHGHADGRHIHLGETIGGDTIKGSLAGALANES